MLDTIVTYLEQLDLSEIEAKLYLKLLETGPISVKDLAQQIGIKRTTAYLYIDQLVDRGLVAKVVTGTKKQVAPIDPENLEDIVNKKLTNTQSLKEKFPKVLLDIKKTFPSFTEVNNFDIKFYKGITNARKIYEEALQSHEVRSYVKVYKKEEQLFPDNVAVFKDAFQQNKELKMWEIIYDSESIVEPSEQIISSTDRYFYLFMPRNLKLSSEDILIYAGKVAIINYKANNTSIVLQSLDFYNNFKELFDFVWNILSEKQITST